MNATRPALPVPAQRWPAPIAEWGKGGVRLRLLPSSHPSADLEPVIAVVGSLAAVALLWLPLDLLARFAGVCRFHDVTGWPCLTCGITRGILALAHGAPLVALRMNPLLIGGLLLLIGYTPIAFALWLLRAPRPRIALVHPTARWTAAAIAAAALLANWAFLILDGR